MSTVPDSSLEEALREHFGFEQFRLGQREVLLNLMAGRSAAAVFPTGSGKSLCYQLPALLLRGVTIVVSPLIALMKDQIDALQSRGIAARRLDSTLSAVEYRDVMDQLRRGDLRMLYVAPERFNNERFRKAIQSARVSLFAVDEAHCISEWGHNFRPDYLKLVDFARLCKAERMLALTATATPQVLDDICRQFAIEPDCVTCTGFYRQNLTLLTTSVAEDERDHVLLGRLQQRPSGPTIIYVTLQRTAVQVANRLSSHGLDARPYHAGMDDEVRAETQDWFLSTDSGIVVATIAFGMGVDKPNIRYVYHYNLPKSLENYSQEIGRAGRDNRPSICEMLLCTADLNVLENFAYGDTPTLAAVRELVEYVFSEDEEFDVSYYELSAICDIRLLVVRTLVTYLELLGYLEGGTPFFSSYRFKPQLSSDQILSRFEGERRVFLSRILSHAKKAKSWFRIDVDRAAAAVGATRDRVVRALDYLGEQQLLELAAQGVRNRYRRIKPCTDIAALATKLHEKSVQREQREIARLHQVVELAQHNGCQVASLCAHFGESLEKSCGHCTWCQIGQQRTDVAPRKHVPLDKGLLAQVDSLRKQFPALSDPHTTARFLCGITTPHMSKAKLSSQKLFGAAAHIRFPHVLQAVSERTS